MQNIFTFLACTLTILLLWSCQKKAKDPEYVYIPQDFKDFICFNQGSYWVYLNNSGTKDSVVLNSQEFNMLQMEEQYSYLHLEELQQTFLINNTSTLLMLCKQYSSYSKSYTYFPSFNSNSTNQFRAHNLSTIGKKVADIEYLQFYDTLSIGNVNYSNVKLFQYLNEKYYFAKNIGLIEIVKDSVISWRLLNYSVH